MASSSLDPPLLSNPDLSPRDPLTGEKKRKRGATRLSCAECRRSVSALPSRPHRTNPRPSRQTQTTLRPCNSLWLLRQARLCCYMSRWCVSDLSLPRIPWGGLGEGWRTITYTRLSLTIRLPHHWQGKSVSNTLLFIRARLSSPPPRHSFVLASTQDLHEKINQLANRVRDLEDALRASHTLHSLDPHPLLSEDLLRIKAPIQRENLINTGATNGNPDEQGADVVDSFGSLSISESGRTNYFGQATSSWVSFPRDRSCHAVLTIRSSLQYYLTVRGNPATSLPYILTGSSAERGQSR